MGIDKLDCFIANGIKIRSFEGGVKLGIGQEYWRQRIFYEILEVCK